MAACSRTRRLGRVLRDTGDLQAAKTIIDRENLPDRVRGETRRVDALASEVKITPYSRDLEQAAKQLATSASAVLKLAKPNDDDVPVPE